MRRTFAFAPFAMVMLYDLIYGVIVGCGKVFFLVSFGPISRLGRREGTGNNSLDYC
jgi:hypothetical protein